jgi:TRAP transporter 4TM/12TM fusion protein
MNKSTKIQTDDLNDLVLDNESGARRVSGFPGKIVFTIALSWSFFQLWIASPFSFYLAEYFDFFKIIILDATRSRYIHLAFALSLVFLSFPATHKSPRNFIPKTDCLLAVLAVICSLYLLVFYQDLSARSGMPTILDVCIALLGILILLEATRRALGPPLVVISFVFLLYTVAGQYMPDIIQHKGHNLTKIASHQWLTTEGVFGIALGVSTNFVFLFVLFGALLEKAGAGNYFIKVAFSLLGHLKGGPAKAAVLSSGMTGLISGSSIANVVTTGTFTVPLMRKVGFSREKAGAVEVASSVNGQIMPPVMGAAAFLMVEYVAIPYMEVIRHAMIPAVISYIALLYIVHLEAIKKDMKTIPKKGQSSLQESLLRAGIIITSIIIFSGICYHILNFIKQTFPNNAILLSGILIFAVYTYLISIKAKYPELLDDPDEEMTELPEVGPTVKTGLHFLLPIAVLIWCLMVERLSPGLSAFWATIAMIFVTLTQNIMVSFFHKELDYKNKFKTSCNNLIEGLVAGAKNMAAIGVATAAAGIIVGVVTQTGVGAKMTELVTVIARDSNLLMLVFTALICLILGMGLPTTANYIVVSSLMATVIVEFGRQHGLIVPLIAVHFFVFYFGIMADVTPPVGLASFAAAAISAGDPIKTSIHAFSYSIRTMILPFIFIYDTELLLIGVNTIPHAIWIFVKSTIAILIFTSATQSYLLVKNKLHENILFLLISFSIFLPSFWIDFIKAPYKEYQATEIYNVINNIEGKNKEIRFHVAGMNMLGDELNFIASHNFSEDGKAKNQLKNYGLILNQSLGQEAITVSSVVFGSKAEKQDRIQPLYNITKIQIRQKQPSKNYIYLIVSFLMIILYNNQRKRKTLLIKQQNV